MMEIFKSIWNKKLKNLLLLLQVIVVITYFFITMASIQKAFYIYKEVQKTIDVKTNILYDIEVQNDDQEITQFNNFCNEVRKITSGKLISYANTDFQSDAFDNEIVGNLKIDIGLKNIKKFKFQSGRFFEEKDFGRKVNPIIIGNKLAKQYSVSVGDVIKDTVANKNCEVIGVLKPDNHWFLQSISDGVITYLDNQIISLIPKKNSEIQMHYYLVADSKEIKGNVIKKINSLAEKFNIIQQTKLVSSELKEQYNTIVSENIGWLSFSILMLVLIALGTATLAVTNVYSKCKEIGVRLAVGYTQKQIVNMFSMEILSIVMAAYVFSGIIGILCIGNGMSVIGNVVCSDGYIFSGDIALIGGVAAVLMCIPSVISLKICMRKLKPIGLIGGR
ncbi:ABC transporter permease [Eubacterium sp. MSJ-13]|uniref:ABC transporter permease n=1 Tax=Eubacterium sp. MSJ-13 TaxID=2841513 RepID=UPI001C11553F|nr:ABC transporter permease [Eubacterium sp. MSJ-13]MBU5478622.1 ABC transporter permease [Eubacterium sp. MSJ-13]